MTLTLAFDTATEVVAIGLGRRDASEVRLVAEYNIEAPRAAGERLLPAVRSLLAEAGVVVSDVSEVVVGLGPGSFTGVRIGVATAKGLACGLGVPLFGVGTLDAVARRLVGFDGVVGVLGDAMRGEVYPCRFRCRPGGCERLDTYTVSVAREAARGWADSTAVPDVLVGNALAKYGDLLREALGERAAMAPRELWTPTGAALLQLASATPLAERGSGEAGEVLPIYTRLSDAEEAERRRLFRDGPAGAADPAVSSAPPDRSVDLGTAGGESR